jgi:hypothetical protein
MLYVGVFYWTPGTSSGKEVLYIFHPSGRLAQTCALMHCNAL